MDNSRKWCFPAPQSSVSNPSSHKNPWENTWIWKWRTNPVCIHLLCHIRNLLRFFAETFQVILSDVQPYSPSTIVASSSSLGTMGGRARTADTRLTSRSTTTSHGQVNMASVADTPLHPPFLHLPLDTDPIWGPPPDHELQTAAHELKLAGRIQSPVAMQNERHSQRGDCWGFSTNISLSYGALKQPCFISLYAFYGFCVHRSKMSTFTVSFKLSRSATIGGVCVCVCVYASHVAKCCRTSCTTHIPKYWYYRALISLLFYSHTPYRRPVGYGVGFLVWVFFFFFLLSFFFFNSTLLFCTFSVNSCTEMWGNVKSCAPDTSLIASRLIFVLSVQTSSSLLFYLFAISLFFASKTHTWYNRYRFKSATMWSLLQKPPEETLFSR